MKTGSTTNSCGEPFFLNINDQLGPGQTLRQLAVLQFELAHLFREWIVLGFGATSMNRQARVALVAPVGEMRRIQTLAAEHGADRSGFLGGTACGA